MIALEAPMNSLYAPFIVDVSLYQTIVNEKREIIRQMDWEKAYTRGVRVAILRATVGDYYTDASCEFNYKACLSLGILPTFYHVQTPEIDAKKQVKYFLDNIPGTPAIPLTNDVELVRGCNRQKITSCVQTTMGLIEEADKRPPMMYTSQGFWDMWVLPWSGWKRYPLDVAWYPWDQAYPLDKFYIKRCPRDWIVNGVPLWDLWQKSADGNGKGREYGAWSGDIDLSYSNGTVEQFEQKFNVVIPDKGYLPIIDDEVDVIDLGNGYGDVRRKPLRPYFQPEKHQWL